MGAGFSFGVPGGAVVAALVAAAMAIAVVRTLRALAASPHRRALSLLRVASAVLGVLVAVQPSWSREATQRSEGRLAILVDASRSMGVGREGGRRWDRARALIARYAAEPGFSRVTLLRLDRDVVPVDVEGLFATPPQGEDTRLLEAVAQLVAEDAREELGAVLVVSDGADTTGRAVDALTLAGVRVHTVATADELSDRDDAIVSVSPDARAYLRTPYRVRARVRARTQAGGTLPVTLTRGTRTLETKEVVLDASGEGDVEFEVRPDRLGRAYHRLELPVADDDVVPENNARSFLVRVARERLRVLLVAGHPTWDVRFLRAFLERDPTNDLISFFILRTNADMAMADDSELALIPFPTDELFRQHLDSFDLVVFQDFDYGPYGMEAYLPLIRRYVEGGGSFAMIGGDKSFASGGYTGTPVEAVLPVTLPVGDPTSSVSLEPFRPEPLTETARHPIVALAPSPDESRAIFQGLAPCIGTNLVRGLREGSVPLLVHPALRTADGAQLPVLSVAEVGRGRSLALTVDGSHRWGLATAAETNDVSVHERFWDRAVRWLARDPALEPSQVLTDRERYGLGASVRAEVVARSTRYEPLAGTPLEVVLLDEQGHRLSSQPVSVDAEGRGAAQFAGPTRVGVYRVVLEGGTPRAPLAEEAFVVEASGDELADPRPRPALLEALASRGRGVFAPSVDEAPSLASLDLTRERSLGVVVHAPFRSPWAVTVLLSLLAVEWIARRRLGLR